MADTVTVCNDKEYQLMHRFGGPLKKACVSCESKTWTGGNIYCTGANHVSVVRLTLMPEDFFLNLNKQ